jgi:hypothetical protein
MYVYVALAFLPPSSLIPSLFYAFLINSLNVTNCRHRQLPNATGCQLSHGFVRVKACQPQMGHSRRTAKNEKNNEQKSSLPFMENGRILANLGAMRKCFWVGESNKETKEENGSSRLFFLQKHTKMSGMKGEIVEYFIRGKLKLNHKKCN